MGNPQNVNFGFVIDNRKCIGCHACTVACKSEHEVPIGVNRTHVKYIEKGVFPNSTREFSVHRCNHCEDAPCVEICPTSALFTREDGIVDFDNERCIGCRSCMQACPYDALYIDPNTSTAAKCNYCAHRTERGFEPACVVVCPVEAIVSGDLKDPMSTIFKMVEENEVRVRKPEKKTVPNLYYLDTSAEILDPAAAPRDENYVWSEQSRGVGHYAKYAQDKLSNSDPNKLLLQLALEKKSQTAAPEDQRIIANVMAHMNKKEGEARRVYDAPSKGVLWGWELPTYIWTKAISSGLIIMAYAFALAGQALSADTMLMVHLASLLFLGLTGAALVKDLDRPDRFFFVLLRPNWSSWLVKGAYIITVFGALNAGMLGAHYLGYALPDWLGGAIIVAAAATAIYTAFLLGQAKARDLWLSKLAPLHMLTHAVLAGSAALLFIAPSVRNLATQTLLVATALNLVLVAWEAFGKHATPDATQAAKLMTKGRYAPMFFAGLIGGGLIPLILLAIPGPAELVLVAAALALGGIFLTEFVRIRTPQLISLI